MESLFPKVGMNQEDVLQAMEEKRIEDVDWKHGRTFSLVYYISEEYSAFMKKAHNLYFSENGLNPMAFKSLKNFEHEVVKMSSEIFHGDDHTVGVMTSGGTESLLMAIKTYRDRARRLKPWITKPEIILPETAHVALDKAGHYFDVTIRHAEVGPDYRVSLKSVQKLINRNTILLVGSAPQYPHGVVDPIIELGSLAEKHHLPLHVDACIGGFLLPFIEKLGYPIQLFDFRIPGVTSISADLHKFGYTAKGASVLLYRSMDIMRYQFFVFENWPGGIYASPAFPGTRPGGPIAAAWAAMKALGEEGYLKQAKKIMDAVEFFKKELGNITDLKLVAYPDMSIVAYTTKDPKLSIYAIADVLEEKGWKVDRQQRPECIHLTIAPQHADIMPQYFQDLKAAVETVKTDPTRSTSGQAAMYGMMAKIPFRFMIKNSVQKIMEEMYGPKGKLPGPKGEDVQSWGDFAEKIGLRALEVKDEIVRIKDHFKEKF
jgi:sphinganine-1-phosphate aldolase